MSHLPPASSASPRWRRPRWTGPRAACHAFIASRLVRLPSPDLSIPEISTSGCRQELKAKDPYESAAPSDTARPIIGERTGSSASLLRSAAGSRRVRGASTDSPLPMTCWPRRHDRASSTRSKRTRPGGELQVRRVRRAAKARREGGRRFAGPAPGARARARDAAVSLPVRRRRAAAAPFAGWPASPPLLSLRIGAVGFSPRARAYRRTRPRLLAELPAAGSGGRGSSFRLALAGWRVSPPRGTRSVRPAAIRGPREHWRCPCGPSSARTDTAPRRPRFRLREASPPPGGDFAVPPSFTE